MAEVLALMEAQTWYIQEQLFLGTINENRNENYSIYLWVLRWAYGA
jgi:hypothetical protein